MSKNIADLYNEVMSQAATEKTASAQGAVFDRNFFEKVASGDGQAVEALNAFIDEARGEGYDDEQIESAIEEAMGEAGVEEDFGASDDFEMAKSAAYNEGAQEAYVDILEKAAGFGVSEEELLEYHLGVAKGQGYAETRGALDEVVEKIAAAKIAAKKPPAGLFSKLKSSAGGMRDDVANSVAAKMQSVAPARYNAQTAKGRKLIENRSRQIANAGMAAGALGTVGAIGGTGAAAGYMAGRRKNR